LAENSLRLLPASSCWPPHLLKPVVEICDRHYKRIVDVYPKQQANNTLN